MTRQWKRAIQVIVGGGGTGLVIGDLRVDFEIEKNVKAEPNSALVKLYNLTSSHENSIKKEYEEIVVSAGYEPDVRTIFVGQIRHVRSYTEGLDRVTEIDAGDGEADYRQATMNITMAAGTTDVDVVEAALASFVGGTVEGPLISVKEKARFRGKVITGSTRSVLDKVAVEAGGHWSIQDGQLLVVPSIETLPDEAIVIKSDTGMIGAPEVDENGIKVTALLNPALKVNALILLDNAAIKEAAEAAKDHGSVKTNGPLPVRLSPDGEYKVLSILHKGSTHALEWYSELQCVTPA